MELNIRRLQDKDWNTLRCWWKEWGFDFVPSKDLLPENGTGGLIVETKDGVGICSVFMYTTNSKLCQVNWPLSNIKFREKQIKDEAFKLLFLGVKNMWRQHDGKYLMFYGENKTIKFQERLEDAGFIKTDDNTYSALMQKI